MQPTISAVDLTSIKSGNGMGRFIQELRVRGFSRATIKAYFHAVHGFLSFFGSFTEKYTSVEVKNYLEHLLGAGKSPNTCNQAIQAIKFFLNHILYQPLNVPIASVKRAKTLPTVFSKEEIAVLLAVVKNQKHRLLLSLAYGAGLRVSEVVRLKIKDLDYQRNVLEIRQAKGKKDRLSLIPAKLSAELQELSVGRDKAGLLFASERGGVLNTRTAQQIFYNALRLARIKKTASFHSLRHSFATHMIEGGTDIRFVQELLGHENIRTTQGYTRVATHMLARLKSPLDC